MPVRITFLLTCLLASGPAVAQTLFASGLDQPHGITQLADGRILVAEFGPLDQISAFAPDGTPLGVFATGLQDPTGILQLADGRVLVTEFNDARVSAFSPTGESLGAFVASFGEEGDGGPLALAQLSDGTVLITDNYSDQVLAYSPEGVAEGIFATSLADPPGNARGILQLADGRVLATFTGPLEAIQTLGENSSVFALSDGWNAGQMVQLADSRILVIDWTFGDVRAFLPDGTDLGVIASIQRFLGGIVALADGRVLVTDIDGNIFEVAVGTAGEPGATGARLGRPMPNPTGDDARLSLTVLDAAPVRVTLTDVLGRHIATVHDGPLAPGVEHRLRIPSARLAPGVYLLRVESATSVQARRLTVAR